MPQPPDFDLNAAHRYFAAACFNRAWDFIDKPQRSPAEDDEMLHLNLTSLWHWSQRSDATPTNLSVGYCQVGRVYALQGEPANALHYAMLSLQASQAAGVEPVTAVMPTKPWPWPKPGPAAPKKHANTCARPAPRPNRWKT